MFLYEFENDSGGFSLNGEMNSMANFNDEKSPAVLNFFDMSSEVCRFYMGNVSWVSIA